MSKARTGSRIDNYFTKKCSGSEAGWYSRLIDFVYHSTLGLRVIKRKKKIRTETMSASGCLGSRASRLPRSAAFL